MSAQPGGEKSEGDIDISFDPEEIQRSPLKSDDSFDADFEFTQSVEVEKRKQRKKRESQLLSHLDNSNDSLSFEGLKEAIILLYLDVKIRSNDEVSFPLLTLLD